MFMVFFYVNSYQIFVIKKDYSIDTAAGGKHLIY